MKKTLVMVMACIAVASVAVPLQAQEMASQFGPDYLVGPGDVLEVSVWKEEALTKQVVVLPDGRISFPLIGEVQAAGRTLPDLKQEISKRMVKYAPKEEVNLEVKQVNSMLIYVIGRVNQPGRFALNTNVNVLQALSIAGGLNPFAKRNDIKIFRREGTATKVLPFKYDQVTVGEKLEQNITLQRGDVIVVP